MAKDFDYSEAKVALQCTQCSKQFKYESARKRHEQSHFPQYECKLCNKKFSFKSALKRHEKRHKMSVPVNCSKCDRLFGDMFSLKRHIDYAHKGESYSCNKCGAEFGSDTALSVHAKSHQPDAQRRFHCSFSGCNKAFSFSHHLKHHELTHSNVKQHYCNACGKGFIQLHHLKTHLKIHDPGNWLSCSQPRCKKKFANEYALKRHIRTHKNNILLPNGTTTYSLIKVKVLCDFCGQLITRKQLTKHTLKCSPQPQQSIEMDEATCVKMETPDKNCFLVPETSKTKENEILLENTVENATCDNTNNNLDISNSCKALLGSCIVTGGNQIDDTCLCAKMSSIQGYTQEIEQITPNDPILKEKENLNLTINTCTDCECYGVEYSKNVSNTEVFTKDSVQQNTADVNITPKDELHHQVNSNIKQGNMDFNNVPFNSCKAVLGNCIVSGDQTIGEGCLCAKMCRDTQFNTQEIEDIITPFTEMTWTT